MMRRRGFDTNEARRGELIKHREAVILADGIGGLRPRWR